MKKTLLSLVLVFPLLVLAQVPSYYNDVNLNQTGANLQTELASKITNTHHTNLSYTPGVWDALKQTDLDPNNSSRVLLIYGYDDNDGSTTNDRSRGVNNNGGGSGDWNREHVYPKSLGTPNLGTSGPGADAHHLRPADVSWNGTRGSRKFTDGSGVAKTVGSYWYPGDEWKGDVARMMMYMYLRYGNRCLPENVGVGSKVNGTDMIDLFLQWNVEDPVSAFEEQRNPILENLQGNRNPFIDNPAFATQIWGGPQAEDKFGNSQPNEDTQAPTQPTALSFTNITTSGLNLSWSASTDNVGVTGYNVYRNGQFIATASSTNYSVSGLSANTSYSFYVNAKDAAGNVSNNSTTINVTTLDVTPPPTGGNELFISEYVEGSSYNKAIEIANFTGSAVNLSEYSLKRNGNGGSSWGTAYNLSGTLQNGDVYVIANSSATSTILNVADATTNGEALSFNGNDPVGLFKNNVLVDVVGNFAGGSANFAKDKTLRRKSSVSEPSTTYTASNWDVLSQNTFDGLGNHNIDGGGNNTPDTEAPTVPTNVNVSNATETTLNVSWNASTDNVAVTAYEVYVNGSLNKTVTSTSTTITGLTVATSYTITVKAKDAANNVSASSTVVTGTTVDTTVPSTPNNLSSGSVTTSSVSLSWSASSDNVGVSAYRVYQNGSQIASTASTSYTVNGLSPNTSYTFYVRAVDAANNTSASSSSISVTTENVSTPTQQVIYQSGFQSGWDGWIDGGVDCSRYSGQYSYDGYSIRLRDNSETRSAMTSQAFNLSGFTSVEFEFYFTGNSMETGEDFWVRYYDGSSWQTVETYVSGTDFNNRTFYVANVVVDAANYNLVNGAKFRVQCDASSNADQVYIDDVKITAFNNSGARLAAPAKNTIKQLSSIKVLTNDSFENDVKIAENPVKYNTLKLINVEEFTNFEIYNLLGAKVKAGKVENSQINTQQLKTGLYILQLNDGSDVVSLKFIKP